MDAELQKYLHIVQDRALRITERVEGFRQLLQNILSEPYRSEHSPERPGEEDQRLGRDPVRSNSRRAPSTA